MEVTLSCCSRDVEGHRMFLVEVFRGPRDWGSHYPPRRIIISSLSEKQSQNSKFTPRHDKGTDWVKIGKMFESLESLLYSFYPYNKKLWKSSTSPRNPNPAKLPEMPIKSLLNSGRYVHEGKKSIKTQTQKPCVAGCPTP